MATFEIVMPKMGESIIEATITKWLKNEGDQIALDEPIVEIATDKVDSEIPSPVEGTLIKVKYKVGDVVAVGEIIAIIDLGEGSSVKQDKGLPAEKTAEIETLKQPKQRIPDQLFLQWKRKNPFRNPMPPHGFIAPWLKI